MAKRRRRRQRRRLVIILGFVGAIAASWWLLYARSPRAIAPSGSLALGERAATSPTRPRFVPLAAPRAEDPAKSDEQTPAASAEHTTPAKMESKPADSPSPPAAAEPKPAAVPEPPPSASPMTDRLRFLIEAGKQALASQDLIAARTHFSQALELNSDEQQGTMLRSELSGIGQETVFSSRLLESDPLVERYVIQPGDLLAKIAVKYAVTADLLAAVNNIQDKNHIRDGQAIKVIKGPIRAVVTKKDYTLDLYLGSALVRSFKVGLGADGSTPTGEWVVGTKLVNPTYYPPRGGDILPADDPKNPLGERWIGLVGIGGDALGQQRYGIHGTTEPDSIGTNASMGCIRMLNEDAEALYNCLVEKHSTVTVR